MARLWPHGTYHMTTIGSMEHLDDASIEDCVAFHHEFYKPNNCSLALVGDFDEGNARRWIDRYFGTIPKGAPVVRNYSVHPLAREDRFRMEDNIKLSEVDIAFHGPKAFDRDVYALDLLMMAMDSSRSSRLYQELVYRRKMAQSVNAFSVWYEKGSIALVTARLQPGSSLEETEHVLWEEIEKLREEPMSETELTKVKNRTEMQMVSSMSQLGSRADRLQHTWCFKRDTDLANRMVEIFHSITIEEMQRAANLFLDRNRAVVSHVVPR